MLIKTALVIAFAIIFYLIGRKSSFVETEILQDELIRLTGRVSELVAENKELVEENNYVYGTEKNNNGNRRAPRRWD